MSTHNKDAWRSHHTMPSPSTHWLSTARLITVVMGWCAAFTGSPFRYAAVGMAPHRVAPVGRLLAGVQQAFFIHHYA